ECFEPATGDVHGRSIVNGRWSKVDRLVLCQMTEKSHVALVEEPDVVHSVADHRTPCRTHPEGKAGVALGIHTAVLQHFGMNQSGAHDLHPPGALASRASPPPADTAATTHLGRRLGEGADRGPEPDAGIAAEE